MAVYQQRIGHRGCSRSDRGTVKRMSGGSKVANRTLK